MFGFEVKPVQLFRKDVARGHILWLQRELR